MQYGVEPDGSAIIGMFYKWFALKKLLELKLLEKYDFLIITRTDQVGTLRPSYGPSTGPK